MSKPGTDLVPADVATVPAVQAEARPVTFAEIIMELDRQREQALEALDHEALIRAGVTLDALLRDLRTLRDQVVIDAATLIDIIGTPRGSKTTIDLEGLGRIEVSGSYTRRNWESAKLLRLLVEHAVGKFYQQPEPGDPRTLVGPHGEPPVKFLVVADPDELTDHVIFELSECLPVNASLQWKLTGLRKRGIEPDDYHDMIENPRKAKLPKRENT